MVRNTGSAADRLASLPENKAKLFKALLEKRSGYMQEIKPRTLSEATPVPASWAQQRLWFVGQMEGGSGAYHISVAVRLHGRLDRSALQGALNAVILRHEVLRTTFVEERGELLQRIEGETRLAFQFSDLKTQASEERETTVSQLVQEELAAPFDFSRGPLIRGRLLSLADDEHLLHIVMHHIVSDGWSMSIFVQEFGRLYDAYSRGQPDPLAPLPIQYADYAVWQHELLMGPQLQLQLKYWRDHLQGTPDLLRLPTDRLRPAIQSFRGSNLKILLGSELTFGLRALSRKLNLTLAMTLQTAWCILLSKLSGEKDIVVGIPVANRRRTELEGLIGFFVNTLAVRVPLADDPIVVDLLLRVKNALLGAYANQDAPFEQVVEALCPPRSLAHSPIFQVMFALQNAPKGELQLPGLTLTHHEVPSATAKFDLSLVLEESETAISGLLNYATDLFDVSTMQRWVACFRVVLHSIVQEPTLRLSKLTWLPEDERRLVLETFNSGRQSYPQEGLVHELFEEQAKRAAHAIAVVSGDRVLTYAQLNDRANQVAVALIEAGVRSDMRVALYFERCPEMIIAILGVLKAGGAYLPLDPNYPAERIEYILRDSGPVVLLTRTRTESLPACDMPVIFLDEQDDVALSEEIAPHQRDLRLENLAYVIYTSGSTGRPKGVAVEHRSLLNVVHWHAATFDLREGCRCSCVAAVGFDAAVWEILPTLSFGATLVLAPPETARDPEALISWWVGQQLDISFMPTPIADLVFKTNTLNQHLRTLLIGGDRLHFSPARLPFSLVNNYGPTECTVLATSGRIDPGGPVHIGRPISNARIYVLDRDRQAVPVGVTGEIYIGGAGVARGYLNQEQMTAERFVPDPFSDDQNVRMYKTGDLARWHADGTLEYVGRNDDQVKIRGFRIELGEVESQLASDPRVKDVAVIVREDEAAQKRIVAYLVLDSADSDSAATIETLRSQLWNVLPEYMVPSAFVAVDALPLTSNGKVDRRALPAPDISAFASRSYEAPRGEIEELLASAWRDLLRVERIGRKDNFFELGGHSLLIVQLIDRLRRAGLSINVRRVFDSPTLEALANELKDERLEQFEVPPNLIPPSSAVITAEMLPLVDLEEEHVARIVQHVPGGATNIQDIYPLAPLQEGLLFHHLMSEGQGDAYILPVLLSVASTGRLDELIAALETVVDRHDVLRSAVLWEQLPRPVQVVYRHAVLQVESVVLEPGRAATEQVLEWLRPGHLHMDISRAPLIQLRVAAAPGGDYWYAMLLLHHITIDHVGLAIVISEVVGQMEKRVQRLPDPIPYRNHVAQAIAYARTQDTETFFRRKLADINEPTAPFGITHVHGNDRQIMQARNVLGGSLAQRVRTMARRQSTSAATLFHAAWSLVVARTAGRDDVVFGTVLLGRSTSGAGAQRMLGMFINTLPLRLSLDGLTAEALVEHTRHELAELLSHEQASLAVAQRCSGISGSAPLFTSLLNYRHSTPDPDSQWSNINGVQVLAGKERTNYPVTMSVDDLGQDFWLVAQTDGRIDASRVIGYMKTAIESLLKALEEMPHAPALCLPILPDAEHRQIFECFNAISVGYRHRALVHELFEKQVVSTPNAIAVAYEGQSLTYAELNQKANQLARHLISEGIGPDQLVGICLQRGVEMVIALLGILKAGGAYLPLDPSYPPERLQYMLGDARPRVVLTTDDLRCVLPATQKRRTMTLTEVLKGSSRYLPDNLSAGEQGLTARHLVYVIYTSGSTGRPKGTAMSHGSMVNLIEWHMEALGAQGRRVLQFAALSFDVAFQEIFSTLCTGRTLLLLDEWIRRDSQALLKFLRCHHVERLFVPPMMLQSLAEFSAASGLVPDSLQDIITAGEQLRITPEIAQMFRNLGACRLHNHYGPTETHVVTALTLTGDAAKWSTLPSIGQPISNTQIYILDARLQPVPMDVVGEIYIGGVGVARGYLHRPELTSERFITDPFSASPQASMYKTGDLGRWRIDGTIEYVGRNDYQVKIRGFRIEIVEIETRLALQEGVKEAAVLAREDIPGEKRLVAYVVPSSAGAPPSTEVLSVKLRAELPEYMVPSAFVMVQGLPLTPNGKLDRRALPAPELGAYVHRRFEAPQGEIEEISAQVWCELLRVERVGRQDNFFDLGGHSLIAMRVISRVREMLHIDLSVRALFDAPTLGQFSTRIRDEADKSLTNEESANDTLTEDFRRKIDAMDDQAVLARIAELENELGQIGSRNVRG